MVAVLVCAVCLAGPFGSPEVFINAELQKWGGSFPTSSVGFEVRQDQLELLDHRVLPGCSWMLGRLCKQVKNERLWCLPEELQGNYVDVLSQWSIQVWVAFGMALCLRTIRFSVSQKLQVSRLYHPSSDIDAEVMIEQTMRAQAQTPTFQPFMPIKFQNNRDRHGMLHISPTPKPKPRT